MHATISTKYKVCHISSIEKFAKNVITVSYGIQSLILAFIAYNKCSANQKTLIHIPN